MKKTVLAIVAAVIGLSVALPVFAAEDPQTENQPEKPKVNRREFTGEIIKVEPSAITLKRKGQEQTFPLTEKVKIAVKDKAAAEMADLKIGDKVKLTFAQQADRLTVLRIDPPDAARPKAPKPPKQPQAKPAEAAQ